MQHLRKTQLFRKVRKCNAEVVGWTFLVQGLRVHLTSRRLQVQPPVQEEITSCRATKPRATGPGACPPRLKSGSPRSARRRPLRRATHRDRTGLPPAAGEEATHSHEDPARPRTRTQDENQEQARTAAFCPTYQSFCEQFGSGSQVPLTPEGRGSGKRGDAL